MSKFEQVVKLLNEYDVRFSGQGYPKSPGDGYTSTSDPNIAGNGAQSAPAIGKQLAITKPFADEHNHYDNSSVLPYPLDHIHDPLATVRVTLSEVTSLIKIALDSHTFTKPEQFILQQHLDTFQKDIEHIKKFIQDLETLTVSY